jgi:hypothetical protein
MPPGEVSLLTLQLAAVPCPRMVRTLSGAQRHHLAVGAAVQVPLDLELVHVMPLRARCPGSTGRMLLTSTPIFKGIAMNPFGVVVPDWVSNFSRKEYLRDV